MFLNWFSPRPKVHDPLSYARVHAVIADEMNRHLVPRGFEAVDGITWVRGHDAPIRQIFQFTMYKGYVLGPNWGVSLDFVPHIARHKVAWHRSNKAAKLDLCQSPGRSKFDLNCLWGPEPLRQRHKHVIRSVIPEAERFWAMADTIDKLPDAIDHLKAFYANSKGLGFDNYTQHRYAVPFIYHQLGRIPEALAVFDQSDHQFCPPETARKLRALLTA